ncbi:MAG TPA: protein kinase [Pirellulaceae bacterium]|nr:protein kinase [Pirellulaceae bacterium]
MPSVTSDTFLTALIKSNLLSPKQLAEAQIEATVVGSGADAKTLARGLIKQGYLTRWQAEQLLAGVTSLFLGRYKLLERIGKGGMGTVYKAEHTVMGRTVALKVMSQSLLNDAGAVARFHREVQAAASLQHPNVVTAYDADCVGKTHFLVMEYVEGHDLKERLHRQGRLSVGWVCECIRQAALGLQHAHEHGMVHRDIKPANLLVTSERPDGPPLVKILDMGLARFVSDVVVDGGLTKSGQVMGTPDYIAPEQAEDTKHADIRADIFSLGCTLFHLLTGQTPYRGDTLMSKLMARMQDTVPPASSLRSDVPQALDAVIAKMLQKKPADRQQTPAEVAAALAPFVAMMDGAFEDTIAVTNTIEKTPTIDMQDSQPKVDTGLNKFLGELANEPDHRKQRVGQRTSKQRRSEPEQKEVASEKGEASEQTDEEYGAKISPRVLTAASCAAVVVLGGLAAFVLTRDSTPVAQIEPVAQQLSDPESALQRFFDEPVDTTSDSAMASPAGEVPTPEPSADATPEFAGPETIAAAMSGLSAAFGSEMEVDSTAAPTSVPNTSAVAAKEPHIPQTLVVGVGTGDLPDLKTAFEQAGPGDTIRIRHRGPLEFNPVELNGKTPLTIVGDTDTGDTDTGGTDFWPIIRQIPLNPDDKTQPTTAVGLFHGDQLDLTLRKLHLAAAGPQRASLGSVFSFHTGRVELDECTVTVGVEGNPGEPTGQPMPFVQIKPASTPPEASSNEKASLPDALEATTSNRASAEVILNRTLLRGLRLQTCLDADSEQKLQLTATHTIWAGGPSPWLVANDHGGGLQVELTNCTVYNTPRLLQWTSYDSTATGKPAVEFPAVEFTVQKSLFVGPYANKEPLMVWNEGQADSGFDRAATEGTVRWQGAENVFHRYASYFQATNARKQSGLDEWRTLWKQSGPGMAQESDPMFRVWPDGEEMQETTARDFQSRFWKSRRGTRIDDERIGAEQAQMPYAFVNIFGRPLPTPDVAGRPRGAPRILRVHQKDGPYKTLEAAFADVQDDGVIEIADDGLYIPQRKFNIAAGKAVLVSPVDHLTIQAGDSANPVIVLRDDVQEGVFPTYHPAIEGQLFLLASGSAFLGLDGLHFRVVSGAKTMRAIVFTDADKFRSTNCSYVDTSPGLAAKPGCYDPAWFAHLSGDSSGWLENNFLFRNEGTVKVDQQATDMDTPAFVHARPQYRSLLFRNCLFNNMGRYALAVGGGNPAKTSRAIHVDSCSVLGPLVYIVPKEDLPLMMHCSNNFVMTTSAVIKFQDLSAIRGVSASGSNNALWLGQRPLTEEERVGDVNAFLPGPRLQSVPMPEGRSTPKDIYGGYRLKKGQPAAKMATDGAPVGVRFEYMPDVPGLPPGFLGVR